MSTKSVLESTFSHLFERSSAADDALLLSLAAKATAEEGAPAAAAVPPDDTGAPTAAPAPEPEPDAYDLEIKHIESQLQSQLAHSQRLTEHLLHEAKRAEEIDGSILQSAEFAHGVVYKKLGLPVHPSNLKVDPALAKNTGLLHAHELLREVQLTRAAAMCEPDDMVRKLLLCSVLLQLPPARCGHTRPGNPPPSLHAASFAARPLVAAQDMAAREVSSRPAAHYLAGTANQQVRLQTSQQKRAALVSSARGVRELRQTKEFADRATRLPSDAAALGNSHAALVAQERSRLAAQRKPRRPGEEPLSMSQLELEEDVLRRMKAPLNFLRNPRHQRKQLMSASEAPLQPPRHPHAGMSFHVRPQVVLFENYAIGGCYEIPLELHNVDSLSRRLRVIPPATPYFSISLVQYPGDDGFVAAGLHARVLVRFAPDSLGDYEDFLLVQTETDSFSVPLRAARRPPALSLGDELDVGWCFVGGSKVVHVGGRNSGGDGKFALLSRAEWEEDEGIAQRVAAESECACAEFALAPRLLDVPAGSPYDLTIRYAPTTVGEHSAEMLLVCDNCHVKPVRVIGHSCAVDMLLESVDGSPPYISEAPQAAIAFAETAVGGSRVKVVRYSNRTPLPISFRWNMHAIARESMAPSRLSDQSVLIWASEECEPPIAHGDALRGMPFAIEPAEGALPAGGVAEFTLTFSPLLPALSGCYAHLTVSGVPEEAMPGAGKARGVADAEVGLQLEGRGTSLALEVSPPAIVAPVPMLIDVAHSFSLAVHNPNWAARTVTWRVAVCQDSIAAAERAAAGGQEAHLGDDGASVDVDPPRLVLGPGESASVRVVAQGTRGARCVRNLECVPSHGATTTVRLELTFEGPHIRITQPVVDFGLIALGESPSVELSFENPTEAHARWWLAPVRGAGGGEGEEKGTFGFSQSMGMLEPGEKGSVLVSYTGRVEHELDTALSFGVTRGKVTHVGVRGQVVAHSVGFDDPIVTLGVTHVRVPVRRTVTLRNRTLLETAWDFDGAEAMLVEPASLTFDPPRGLLPPGGAQQIHLTLTSATPGTLDAVVRCNVPRMARALGLRLQSEVHGLVVSYTVEPATGEGTALGRELDELVGQMHAPPEHAYLPPAPLHFGRAVPCFEERHLLLVLRNHSSVHTRFSVRARDHPALVELAPPPAPPSEGMSSATLAAVLARGSALRGGGSRAGGTSRPQLSDAHEPLRRFQSLAGTRHVHDKLHVERKRALFADGDEIAYEVTPSQGVLPPWGRVALVVSAHTQMWGDHPDVLLCEVDGLPLTELPLDIGVLGSPLSLVCNAVGYSMRTVPPELSFPPRPLSHPPLVRRISVRNDSAMGAAVEWGLFEPPTEGRLLSAELAVDPAADGRVRLTIGPPKLTPIGGGAGGEGSGQDEGGGVPAGRGPEASVLGLTGSRFSDLGSSHGEEREGPRAAAAPLFSIEPRSAAVPPHSTVDFKVTFAPTAVGSAAARLVAQCTRTDGRARAGAKAHPPIALDLRGSAREPRLEFSERRKLKFQVSPLDAPATHGSYRRDLLVANREDAPLDFSLRSAPPFEIVGIRLSAGATTSTALSAQTGESASAKARCVLPPGESVLVKFHFTPTEETRADLSGAEAGVSSEASPRGSVDEEEYAEEDVGELPDNQELHRYAHAQGSPCAAWCAPSPTGAIVTAAWRARADPSRHTRALRLSAAARSQGPPARPIWQWGAPELSARGHRAHPDALRQHEAPLVRAHALAELRPRRLPLGPPAFWRPASPMHASAHRLLAAALGIARVPFWPPPPACLAALRASTPLSRRHCLSSCGIRRARWPSGSCSTSHQCALQPMSFAIAQSRASRASHHGAHGFPCFLHAHPPTKHVHAKLVLPLECLHP